MSGVDAVFEGLHGELRGRLERHLRRLVGPAEAEDLLQEVMLKIHRGLPAFRGEAGLATWAHRIATRTALDHLRRPRRESPAPEVLEAAATSPGDPDRPAMRDCIRAYVETLPDPHARVLHLADLEELDVGTVAERLGLTVGATKIRLHRARRLLRAKLSAGCCLGLAEDGELRCERRPAAR